jgi:RNA polymerase sigma factor (sigma-70 family)
MNLESLSDADLLARWCAGDRLAGDALTGRHFTALRSFVRRKIDDRVAIDEIVQDTLLALVTGRHKIRDGMKFRGFLNCIASRRVYKWFRDRGGPAEFDPEQMSLSQATTSFAVKKSDTKLLYRALRELPAEEQLALELFNWEELSAPEIAELTGATLPQVKHRLRRGKEKLEALVSRFEQEPGANAVDTQELAAWFSALKQKAAGLDEDARK